MKIKVCQWWACKANFASYIITRIKRDIEKFDLKNIEIEETLCMWMCKQGPNVKIDNDQIINNANPSKISELMFKKLKK